ncbi:MAG TPA: glycosyltransferase family 4 protein [Solirubrobacterales bacterium]|nr:glycosyltransferase family 4 protein [Solirubrobacterales bacterium]
MKILVFHGYMLRGTGSNIYNANLARALARLGHEVHLLCQDREVKLEGVQIHNPEIGGLLPVYVVDPYEGFEVKAFPQLSEAELEHYMEANVAAVRGVAEAAGGIDAAVANHLIMGPAILARAGVAPFAAKIHGSALEYTVKPNPRFLPYAREGLRAASGVLVGSAHTAESLWATLPDIPGLRGKTRLGPPGVDTEEFRPAGERGPLIVFVGKLIVSKGVDLLLAAWPLLHAAQPKARLQIAGFGEYEDGLRRLKAALDRGDLAEAREVASLGRRLEGGGEAKPLAILAAFLADPPSGYAEAALAAAGSVEFLGRQEHDQVAELLPQAEALVMPSTFPEAFGMVAVEAAACGALPVSSDHSGMGEVSRQLAPALAPEVAGLTSFPLEAGAVEAIAQRLDRWLALPPPERAAARRALVETVRRLWSWEGVARGALAAAGGRLGELAPPG